MATWWICIEGQQGIASMVGDQKGGWVDGGSVGVQRQKGLQTKL